MSHIAIQYDTPRQQHYAATMGMWVFLVTELMFFGGLFGGYAVYRHAYPEAFAIGSGHVSIISGTVMTGVLLASSLSVALADRAIRNGKCLRTMWLLGITILLGIVFLGIKAHEYLTLYKEHLFPGVQFDRSRFGHAAARGGAVELYFVLYVFMTAVHALHVTVGLGLLTLMLAMTGRGDFDEQYSTPVENSGLYWHFVDIIWVFLYPLLYLIQG